MSVPAASVAYDGVPYPPAPPSASASVSVPVGADGGAYAGEEEAEEDPTLAFVLRTVLAHDARTSGARAHESGAHGASGANLTDSYHTSNILHDLYQRLTGRELGRGPALASVPVPVPVPVPAAPVPYEAVQEQAIEERISQDVAAPLLSAGDRLASVNTLFTAMTRADAAAARGRPRGYGQPRLPPMSSGERVRRHRMRHRQQRDTATTLAKPLAE
jgi:hypothetical protein